jgi:3-hydroxybutyryl-CoA dehydrogenase
MHYHCKECKKSWSYPLVNCIFCGNELTVSDPSEYKVIGCTEVNVPSIASESVPYYVYLLEDERSNRLIQKSSRKYELGDIFELDDVSFSQLKIGIIGSGLLGSQLTEYVLQHGYLTILKTRSDEKRSPILNKIKKHISKKLSGKEVEKYLTNLEVTTDYSDLHDCDIVIEAVSEDIGIKKEVLAQLSSVCKEDTIIATNTSSISIDLLADVSLRPDRFIGMHFFNPVHKMDLVEVIIGKQTSPETQDKIVQFSMDLNKKPVIVKNCPGFVVNRYLLPQINEAVKMLEEGIATKEDIDSAIKLGLNHPMGPFELADLIGLDVCLSILEVMSEGFNDDKFTPSKMLIEKVNEGNLGFKTGEGFYKY